MSLNEIGSMVAMQGFSGLSLFTVLLLMALGLAIIFGQMGVINMAHGEFMAIGAYVVYLFSQVTQNYLPGMREVYFIPAVVAAFVAARWNLDEQLSAAEATSQLGLGVNA